MMCCVDVLDVQTRVQVDKSRFTSTKKTNKTLTGKPIRLKSEEASEARRGADVRATRGLLFAWPKRWSHNNPKWT